MVGIGQKLKAHAIIAMERWLVSERLDGARKVKPLEFWVLKLVS